VTEDTVCLVQDGWSGVGLLNRTAEVESGSGGRFTLLAVLTATALLLLLLALLTLLRHRKLTQEYQACNSHYPTPPPDYLTVLAREERDLPSYRQAAKSKI